MAGAHKAIYTLRTELKISSQSQRAAETQPYFYYILKAYTTALTFNTKQLTKVRVMRHCNISAKLMISHGLCWRFLPLRIQNEEKAGRRELF